LSLFIYYTVVYAQNFGGVQAEAQPDFAKDLESYESYVVVRRHLTMSRKRIKILLIIDNGETVN